METWFLRRMQRIPWIAKVTNEEVLRRAGEERTVIKCIRRRQLKFLGHILRARGMSWHCLLGRIDGKRAEEDNEGNTGRPCWEALTEDGKP